MATELGLAKQSPDGLWEVFSSSDSDLPEDVVKSVHVDATGDLWMGFFTEGLARLSGGSWTFWNSSSSDLPGDFIRDIDSDASGDIWLGTGAGVVRFDGLNFDVWDTGNSDLPANNIPCIYLDDVGFVWAGTINGGLARFNSKTWDVWDILNSDIPDNTVLDIAEDRDGLLWLATPAGGLVAFTEEENFIVFNTLTSSIPDNEVFRVVIDYLDRVVIGMASRGLLRFDGSAWEQYNTGNSAIPDDVIFAVVEGADSTIWLGTQSGGAAHLIEDRITGIWEDVASEINLYPNPVQGFMQFTSDPGPGTIVSLYNLEGKVLMQKEFGHLVFLPSDLESGNYIVELSKDAAKHRFQILVQQ